MLKLTVWMNHPSHHQDDVFSTLARASGVDLEVIYAYEMTAHRAKLGYRRWNTEFPSRLLETPVLWDAARLARRQSDRWHVVDGIWAEWPFVAALIVLRVFRRGTYVIYSESEDTTVRRSALKRWLRKSFGRWIAGGAAGLLAISELSERFYEGIGFRPEQVYRFGYFQSGEMAIAPAGPGDPARIEIVFAGQFIRRKGIELLLEALSPLWRTHPGLHLTLIGSGPDENVLRSAVTEDRLDDRVTFAGVVPADKMRARIAAADLLALPSRFDGWGLVVNEAMSVGVPVVVSDRCGAAELVRHGVNGYVFPAENVPALRACLEEFAGHPERHAAMRAAARDVGRRVAAEVAVPYLVACLRHMADPRGARPVAPWLAP